MKKNLLKVIGIIALAAVIGFSMTSCGEKEPEGCTHKSADAVIKFTGLNSVTNFQTNDYAFVVTELDKDNQFYGYGKIDAQGTVEVNMYCMECDEPYFVAGKHFVMIGVGGPDLTDAGPKKAKWAGAEYYDNLNVSLTANVITYSSLEDVTTTYNK